MVNGGMMRISPLWMVNILLPWCAVIQTYRPRHALSRIFVSWYLHCLIIFSFLFLPQIDENTLYLLHSGTHKKTNVQSLMSQLLMLLYHSTRRNNPVQVIKLLMKLIQEKFCLGPHLGGPVLLLVFLKMLVLDVW